MRSIDHPVLYNMDPQWVHNITAQFAVFEQNTGAGRMLGVYVFDWGRSEDRDVGLLRTELEFARRMLHAGRIDGVVFVATDMVDLPLRAVAEIRGWVRGHGGEPLPS